MISKSNGSSSYWLFPECFAHLLEQQHEDGSWPSYASQSDGILNTAASLLALQKHSKDTQQQHLTAIQNLTGRIEKATSALRSLLDQWNVEATVHVGFEILIPALLTYLEQEGLHFDFAGKRQLYAINAKKLAKFRPEYLYTNVKMSALHSLEAFIGNLDFDRVRHHKVRGAFMASPSSTAAYLMNSSTWDDECEAYLRKVVVDGAGNSTGGIPSAFPSTIFELTWGLSTLSEGGFNLHNIASIQASKAIDFLSRAFAEENGLLGFAPYVGADADDTAKTILSLNLMGCPTSPRTLLEEFEDKTHFKTYQQERDPSFSANCNVLSALLHVETPSDYTIQIEKTLEFLCTTFQDSDRTVRDKWNISPFYPFMLMMQASTRLLQLWRSGCLPAISDTLVTKKLLSILSELCSKTLHSQNLDGSWGDKGFQEETAYAVLVLAYSLHLPCAQDIEKEVNYAIESGRTFLNSRASAKREDLWVEKVTYASEILSESYILAALNIALPVQRHDSPMSATESAAYTNGDVTSALNSIEINGVKTEVTNGSKDVKSNGTDLNYVDSVKTPFENHINTGGAVTAVDVQSLETSTLVSNGTNGAQWPGTSLNGLLGRSALEEKALSTTRQSDVDAGQAVSPTTWSLENESILLGPFNYLEQEPGKDIRTQFIRAFNTWLDVPPDKVTVIANVVKMLHTASLLIDDIEDSSVLRRGVPVAHSIFGIPQTFNSGNYIYFLALQEVQKLQQPQATNIFVQELLNLHRGQGMDLYWRDSLTCPSEHEYLDMVSNKTGGLFRLAVKLMEVESPHDRNCEQLVDLMGRIFQIRDDYMNLFSTDYTQNKGLCEDLTEGKFSFPIIHSIRSDPVNRQLMNILKQKSSEERIKRYAVSIMERTGSFEYTRDFVRTLKGQASELIASYQAQGWGNGDGVRKILARLDLD
ncbi:MAG: hypothetical protein Q9165_007307 [Trypethelium subeluteriae]